MGLTEGGGVLPDGLNAAVGGTVNFTTNLSPTETPFQFVSWSFGADHIPIITSDTTSNITGPEYEGRITLFTSTGSLELRNLKLSDGGDYAVTVRSAGELAKQGQTRLAVYEPVSNVIITLSSNELVEFNSSVSLSCSSSGSPISFLWMNGSSVVTASDRVQLRGSTLTIVNVTRYDNLPFRCRAFNPVSDDISGPANLSIYFGPENINLTLSPSKEHYLEGSNITLNCSANSKPSAEFTWFLNGNNLPDAGPELRLMNIQLSQSGSYSCQAFNHKTLRYQSSQPSDVSVLKTVSGASVKPSTDLQVEGTTVNLTCEASGSIFTRKWMKDGLDLIPSDNITLSEEDKVLTFKSVNRKNAGIYLCKISNPVSTAEVSYSMVVNYGPEKVQITGEREIRVNEPLKLTCSAESTPSATYRWLLNGTEILPKSATFSKENAEFSDSGNYTCEARNNITERTSSDIHELFVVLNLGDSSPALSPGAIAGIVIACLVVVAAAASGGYYMYRKR
ncbi:cell adhesion molecule CEACAM5-like [Leuresthes tenuis]|uniref:cell adhesion molecule CEACAM5-like n=1 Tax=Leuresthes tenuis TaxID=355514 RepID=UPI003B5114D8